MFLFGTVVDALSIILGTAIGMMLPRIPDRMRDTVTKGLALCVIVIGLSMALSDMSDILLIIISIVAGTILGELLNIEGVLNKIAHRLERVVTRIYRGPIAEGFISSTLLYCIGSMAIVGAIQDGIQGEHRTLLAKSMLDGFMAVVLSSTLGLGVGLSAIPVFLYQGTIAFVSHLVGNVLNTPMFIDTVTATGGLLIVAIGLNISGLAKIAVGNMLPAIVLAPVCKEVVHVFHGIL
ncbi:hypothetical protein C7445_11521 [Alicyclobacillus sacchari]|uniref:DUF554 domain-containing protein n=1 Tax=Alicyclobacillus sacchari TaxID=392010 RepID=A0A4R8LIY3_9BACL|nr:DUF554 domain-containing protein [Alicyclobacillus sacchari]TDY42390.1 hypothetical protein C7445_11521 [Alicyclobacillus sacchari]GMA57326.1 membrane protein [Alicyclobacillus sacchari]